MSTAMLDRMVNVAIIMYAYIVLGGVTFGMLFTFCLLSACELLHRNRLTPLEVFKAIAAAFALALLATMIITDLTLLSLAQVR